MSSNKVENPYPIFTDTNGRQLENGYIYIGQPGLDAEFNQVSIYLDPELTTPVSQPVRTSGGYPVVNGAVFRFYVNGNHSIKVKNKKGELVYTANNANSISGSVSANFATLADAKAATYLIDGCTVKTDGYYSQGDGGSNEFYYDASSSATANDGSIVALNTLTGRLIQKNTTRIHLKQFGAKGDGSTNDASIIQSVLDSLNEGDSMSGGDSLYRVGTTIDIPNKINIRDLKIIASSSVTDQVLYARTNAGDWHAVEVDCSETDARGIRVERMQNAFWDNIRVLYHRDNGIQIDSGYEMMLSQFETIGRAAADGGPLHNTVSGVQLNTSDSHISEGASVRTPRGLDVRGGNNFITRVHNWSVFTSGEQQMGFCFHITGEANSLVQCMADTPNTFANSAASPTNGGYGYYFADNAINCRLIGSTTFWPAHVDAPTNRLKVAGTTKIGLRIIGHIYIDRNGTAISSQPYDLVSPYYSYGAGGIDDTIGETQSFTPTLVVGGSSSGITYFAGRQKGISTIVGSSTEVKIHLRITGFGGNTGAIHIAGLPETIFDEGNAWAVAGTGWIDSIGVVGVRYIASTNELRIYQISGAQFDHTTFPLNQEVNVSVNYRRVV